MTFAKRIVGNAALGAAILIGFGLSAPSANAAYIVTLEQVGTSVVATGSGSLDLTDLTSGSATNTSGFIQPSGAEIVIAPGAGSPAAPITFYSGVAGPTNFGTGGLRGANSGNGDGVGVENGNTLVVPTGYVSGSALPSANDTFSSATFSGLGATSGTYEWTWGSGAHVDSFILQIGTVPAPLIGHGLLVLLAVGGVLFGSKLLERRKKLGLHQFG